MVHIRLTMDSAKVVSLNQLASKVNDQRRQLRKLNDEAMTIIQSVEPTPETFDELWEAFLFFEDIDLELECNENSIAIHTNSHDDDFDEVLMVKILGGIYEGLEYSCNEGSTQGSVLCYSYKKKRNKN